MENLFLILIFFLLVVSVILFFKYRTEKKKSFSFETQKKSFEIIFKEANDAVLVLDIVNGHIFKANPSLAKLLGYTTSELEKLSIFDLHPKEHLHLCSEIIADVWEKKGLLYNNLPFVTSSGEFLPAECSAKISTFNGKPAIIIYVRDIRERLRLEKEIRTKNEVIEEKNKDILDSIRYAKRIQNAILAKEIDIKTFLPNSFLLYKPKDIVAGDFYFFEMVNDNNDTTIFIAACDCTGHGVPGALVSVVCCNALSRCVKEFKLTEPGEILDKTSDLILETFSKSGTDIKDGMDISLLSIKSQAPPCLPAGRNSKFQESNIANFSSLNMGLGTNNLELQWSGANNPLWYIQNGEFKEIKADKQPIGKFDFRKPFTTHNIEYSQNSIFFLFTDGLPDQFGGPSGKKFMYKRFAENMISNCNLTMQEQEAKLDKSFQEWKGTLEQVDDITVIGIKI